MNARLSLLLPAVVVVALLLPACLVGEVDDIPCTDDEHCASHQYCDIPRAVCAVLDETSGPPALVVHEIVDPNGTASISPFIERDVVNTLRLRVKNEGLSRADTIQLQMSALVCTHLDIDESTVPDSIDAGETAEMAFSVRPTACGTPMIQDWFLLYSGRGTRGQFNMNLNRTRPSGD